MEERRRNYPDILAKLNELEKNQAVITTLQSSSKEWQDKVGCKIDRMEAVMSKLPCDSRMIMIDSSGRQMKFLWGVISSVVISLIIVVAANISVIGELRKEITAVKEELIFIKNHSYGVQEYLNGGKKASQLP